MNHKLDKLFALILVIGLASVISGAKGTDTDADTDSKEQKRLALPVVEINGKPITLGEFESVARTQSPLFQNGLSEKQNRDEFLNKILNMELLAREAARRGYNKDPEVLTVRKNQLATLMNSRISEKYQSITPTDADMRKYYQEHIENYDKPEKVRARHILIKDKAAAQRVLDELVQKKASQYEFRRVAQEKSVDEYTKTRGGDLTFFTRTKERRDGDPDVDPRLVDAAFSLKENGEIYPKLVETDRGFHILMRTGHRKAMKLSFEEAKDRLVQLVQRELHQQKTDAAIEELMKKFQVTLFEENLKNVVIDLSGNFGGTGKVQTKDAAEDVENTAE